MRTSVRLGLIALTAALLLASAVGTASARRLSFSNQNIRMTWSRIEFVTNSGIIIRCPTTLEGSFHARTIAKTARSLIGAITRAILKQESCTNGRGVGRWLPWHLTYESFSGTLPNITSLQLLISRFRFLAVTLGFECEYGNETDRIVVAFNLSVGEVTSTSALEGSSVMHLVEPSDPLCPTSAMVRGTGDLYLLGTTNRIRVTLI